MMCSFVVSYAKFKDRALGLLPCPLMHVNWMKSGILLVAFLCLPLFHPKTTQERTVITQNYNEPTHFLQMCRTSL